MADYEVCEISFRLLSWRVESLNLEKGLGGSL